MSLPSAFDGGSTNGPAFDALLTKMRGSGQAAMANNLNSARSSYALIMVDTADAKRDAIVNVQEATIPAAMTLDAYVDNGVKAVLADKAGYKQQARLKRTIDGKEAIKVVFSLESDNETLAQYFVRDGTKLWAFTYTAATPSFLSGLGTDYETSALNAKLKA